MGEFPLTVLLKEADLAIKSATHEWIWRGREPDDQSFINLMPTRFASYRASLRDMIFCHRYSAYMSHILWRGLKEDHGITEGYLCAIG